jgi:ADP-heptose:LPS heptosyltransferase
VFAALLAHAACFICLDSGPLHVASAVNAPTVALFGPSRPWLTGPYRNKNGAKVIQRTLSCSPCKGKKIKCRDNQCMKQVSVSEVMEKVQELLEAGTREPKSPVSTPYPAAIL